MQISALQYSTAQEFAQRLNDDASVAEGHVQVASAPDGLPLVTVIDSPPVAASFLRGAAACLEIESSASDYEGTPLGRIAKDLEKIIRAQRIQHLSDNAGGSIDALVLPQKVTSLCGDPLFAQLFGSARLAPTRTVGASVDTRATLPGTVPNAVQPAPPPLPAFTPGEARLALPINGTPPIVVRKELGKSGWPKYSLRRAFCAESIAAIEDSVFQYSVQTPTGERYERLESSDLGRYQTARAEWPNSHWTWNAPRLSVAKLVLELTQELARLHERGEVHGDVKPANVLITPSGVRVIDSLALPVGDRTPAMTRGWAAPEQVLGTPVSEQTDQYSIGLLLLDLLKGVLYGEEARILIPTGGRKLEAHTVLRNPGVYIDPADGPIDARLINPWRALIERCVRFDAGQRFASMRELGAELSSLIEKYPLQDVITCSLYFGRLAMGRTRPGGEASPCWLPD